ncbi:hypothetical protein [Oryza sativa Japonica Group]|uniref:Uncharacterized protein n=1 Tax=Oryza sativa subsp. japonica TaxID=39947 RepID=Q656Y6_ORYSJ|nr:hypothetical protein [Oryza sativa Japonica Group]
MRTSKLSRLPVHASELDGDVIKLDGVDYERRHSIEEEANRLLPRRRQTALSDDAEEEANRLLPVQDDSAARYYRDIRTPTGLHDGAEANRLLPVQDVIIERRPALLIAEISGRQPNSTTAQRRRQTAFSRCSTLL